MVGVALRSKKSSWALEDSLEELKELARSSGAEVVSTVTQILNRPSPVYLGTGKIEELKDVIKEHSLDVVIFDDELSPTQQHVLEGALRVKVIDRTALILDIFAQRARTREGQLQTEMAQVQYLLPRLAGQWSHLERMGGGIGTRGPGETQIETDRRIVRARLKQISQEIEKVRISRRQQRIRRSENVTTVALVGYTNAGKSTIFNSLTNSDMVSRDQLFSTLDTTVRRLYLPSGKSSTLIDTVGFVNKLPAILVAAFRATLEEIQESSLLLHVLDISNPYAAQQAQTVDDVLANIGLGEIPKILVLNKLDLLTKETDTVYEDIADIAPIKMDHYIGTPILVSGLRNWGIEEMRRRIEKTLSSSELNYAVDLNRSPE